jgi:uncharacterized protein (TIGR03437 family)
LRPAMRKNTILPLVVLSGLFIPVYGQTLTVVPQQLSFNVAVGVANSTAQIVTVTPDAATGSAGVAFAVNTQAAPWLRVNGTTAGTVNATQAGASLSVSVNTQGLISGQNYNGSFTVQISNVPASQQTVNVNLFVGGASALFATPSTLSFTAIQGASVGSPNNQSVTISSTAGPLSFTLSSQTQSGGSWISLSSTGGVTGGSGGTFSVSVLPAGLTPGTYTGTITAQSTTTGDLAQITVSLTVSATVSLTASPATLPVFLYQTGGAIPAAQSITLTTNGGPVSFTVSVNPAAPWLVVSPLSGTASSSSPAAITLTPTPTGLPPNSYSTSVVITPAGGPPLPAIPVSLVVTNNPVIQVTPPSLVFLAQFAGQPPIDKILNVTAAGGSVGFTVTTTGDWLTATASGNSTPAQITAHVNTAGLGVGSYDGSINIRPANGDNYTLTVPVKLTISNPVQLSASPSALLFSFQTNQSAPGTQTIQIRSSGAPVQFTATPSTSNCGSNWLSISPSQGLTPSDVSVVVAASGLTPGICTGTISVSFTGASGPVQVGVTVAVSGSALLSISQPKEFGNEIAQQGANAITRTLALTSTDPTAQVTFAATATTSTSGGWLTVGPGTGTTPQNLLVSILPGALTPGTYGGQITITSPSLAGLTNNAFILPVNLTINPPVTVTATPAALTFTQRQGGPLPNNQSITLTSNGGTANFVATITQVTGGDWLDVNPTSGAANRDLTVSIKQNSLPVSSTAYSAQIVLTFPNSSTAPITIPVSLTVTSAQTITLTPTSLTFAAQAGAPAPAAQKLAVASGGTPVQFTVGTTSTPGGWLSVDATSGTTPKDLNVSVNTQGLAAGTYNGSVSITVQGQSAVSANVTLTVTPTPVPLPATVTNAASGAAGAIAPGELITIKGTLLGPANAPNGGQFTLNAQGGVDPNLAGVRVLFDNIPGTPLYVSPTQINVIAPWEIAGRLNTNLVVEYNGVAATAIQLRVDNVSPAIFTLNFTGAGQAAVLNQDSSVNGSGRPAAPNSIIAVYATGGGQTSPAGITGSVSPGNQLLRITGPVSATIGGVNAPVEFIGAAPGLVTGVVQANLRVPAGVSGSNLPLSITINGVTSPTGPTVAVQQ